MPFRCRHADSPTSRGPPSGHPPGVMLAIFALVVCVSSITGCSTNRRRSIIDGNEEGSVGSTVAGLLDSVGFARPNASGLVSSRMVFEPVQLSGEYQEDYPYLSDSPGRWSTEGDESATHGGLHYLFERLAGDPPRWAVPPTGMRSAVPLGALGGGSLELRADGALRDWRLLNNHPAALNPQGMKQSFESAALGLWVGGPQSAGGTGRLLRTQLPSPTNAQCAVATVASGNLTSVPVGLDLEQQACNDSAACASACCAVPGCSAFLFEPRTDARMGSCIPGKPCCFLKSKLANTMTKTIEGTIGNVTRYAQPFPTPQPPEIERVQALRYSAAFPVSRLDIVDRRLLSAGHSNISASLFGYSRFAMHDANATAAPAITFATVLRNLAPRPVRVSVVFTLPDVLKGGSWSADPRAAHTICLTKPGSSQTSGELCLRGFADGAALSTSWVQLKSLHDIWQAFKKGRGEFVQTDSLHIRQEQQRQGALAVTITVPPYFNVTAGFVMAWYLPHRDFAGEPVGQFYSNLFPNADAVANDATMNMRQALGSILSWNRWVMDTDGLSTGLKDLLVNSPATFFKTGLWLKDGRWRQFESYSCDQMENAHLHAPRVLAMFGLGWPQLDLSVLQLYNKTLQSDGYVPSLFGGGCNGHGPLDVGDRGRLRGDDNSLFILDAFSFYRSVPGGAAAVHAIWPAIQNAAEWNFRQAAQYGTIQSRTLINTFDGIPREGDVCTYTSILYLASLAALEKLAHAYGNRTLVVRCRTSKVEALKAVQRLLWTGTHFRGFACDGRGVSDSNIQGDSLYGQLWALILGLDTGISRTQLRSHLSIEREWATTKDGVLLFSNRTTDYDCKVIPGGVPDFQGYLMDSVWNAHIVDSAAVRLHLNDSSWASMLGIAIHKWREVLRDQWDVRDLDWRNDTEAAVKVPGAVDAGVRPFVNSHYSRHLLGIWALVGGISAQQHDMPARTLSFVWPQTRQHRWPFYTAMGNGHLRAIGSRTSSTSRPANNVSCFEVVMLSGSLCATTVILNGKALAPVVDIEAGENVVVCE